LVLHIVERAIVGKALKYGQNRFFCRHQITLARV